MGVKSEELKKGQIMKKIFRYKFIYFLLIPSFVLVIIFSYIPMKGIIMAFQDYNIYRPEDSTWIGLENFKQIFVIPDCIGAIVNTLKISLLNIIVCYPITIIFALLINQIALVRFKKIVQTVSYLPYFLSWISVIGIVSGLYASDGLVNDILVKILGGAWERKSLLSIQEFFVPDVIILTLWKELGWNSVIFLAALTGIDTSQYEAAMIDGANKFQQEIHITIPSILPTIMIMLIWKLGSVFGSNFELVYGLQNAFANVEVIGTLVYKYGITGGNYQLSTAFGLFQGVVNIILLIFADRISKKTTEVGLF